MIAVDTNILVRFLVRDDEKQAIAVYKRLKRAEQSRESLLVPLLVVLETVWVLKSAYRKSRDEILDTLDDLRRMPVFVFERNDVLQAALAEGRTTKADIADLLIAHSARSSGGEGILTLDKRATVLPFFQLLK